MDVNKASFRLDCCPEYLLDSLERGEEAKRSHDNTSSKSRAAEAERAKRAQRRVRDKQPKQRDAEKAAREDGDEGKQCLEKQMVI